MQFLILGPFEVRAEDRSVPLGGSRQRALLALLVLHRNEVVSSERIIDELWGERPPKTASQAVRVYVSQLRKALEPERAEGAKPQVLATRGAGYTLRVQADELDLDRFVALADEGRRLHETGDAKRAAAAFRDSLALWRGPPLADFSYESFAQSEIARLDECAWQPARTASTPSWPRVARATSSPSSSNSSQRSRSASACAPS